MLSSRPTQTAFAVLALTFALSFTGRGASETFPVFLLPISTSFGWDRAQVLSIYSIAALTGGLSSPLIGRLFDRMGPRAVYSLGLTLIGASFSAAPFAQSLWQLQFALGFCMGLGVASIGNVPNAILLGRWFGARLPFAMSLIYSALGAGVLVMVPVSQVLIDSYGWRAAYQMLGFGALTLLVLLQLLPWRTIAAGNPDNAPKAASTEPASTDWTLAKAMRSIAFWSLFSTFFFTAIGMYAITAQVIAYLVDVGFTPLQAATAWGFSGVVLTGAMLGITWLDALIGRRPAILISYGLSFIGIAMFWMLQFWPSAILLAGFVICFGSTVGSRGPLISATAMNLFRGKNVGTIFGAISTGPGLGTATGSWCGGLIHDASGGYNLVILFAAVATLIGMLPFLLDPALRE